MVVATIVDAGPLIGWFNRSDQWHSWSVETLGRCRGPLFTTEIVVGEACYHLGGNGAPVQALLTLVRQRSIQLYPTWPEHLERTQALMLKYPDRMDPADASLVVLSELYPSARLVTVDAEDFGIYRRFGDQPLPLILPPPN